MSESTIINISSPVELRASGRLYLKILEEGRSSEHLRELFVVGASKWDSSGIKVRHTHKVEEGSVVAFPYRKNADILLNVDPSIELREAFENGKKYASVEFHALETRTTKSKVREVLSALIVGVALTSNPAYIQTSAEIREEVHSYLPDDYIHYL